MSEDFTGAVNALKQEITAIFPAATTKRYASKYGDSRRISGTQSRHNSGRGRRGGRNGQRSGRNSGRFSKNNNRASSMCNGVDISNPTRSFTDDEWKKLPVVVRNIIHAKRKDS